jgi:hypothetical protein
VCYACITYQRLCVRRIQLAITCFMTFQLGAVLLDMVPFLPPSEYCYKHRVRPDGTMSTVGMAYVP